MAINSIKPTLNLDTKAGTGSSPFVAGGSVSASYAMGPGATVPNTNVGGGTDASASSFAQVMQQQQAANASYQQQASGGMAGGVPVSTGTDAQAASFGSVLQQQAAMNMQYLELQNTMQQENQQFSTLSNVLKVRHDTAKNSISNIH